MVITGSDKLFVTNDASTILRELDVFHPAARLVLMNSTRLQEEVRSDVPTRNTLWRLMEALFTGRVSFDSFLSSSNLHYNLTDPFSIFPYRLVTPRTSWSLWLASF